MLTTTSKHLPFLSCSAIALSCCLRSLAHLENSSCALTEASSFFNRTTSALSSDTSAAFLAVGVGNLLNAAHIWELSVLHVGSE